jgi:phosphoglycerol transferase MdoB-like AlkP superfamily enzyme
MKSFLTGSFRFLAFWLLFFAISRTVFLAFFISKWKTEGWVEFFQSYRYGLIMDLATSVYIGALPLLIWIFLFITKRRFTYPRLFNIYNIVFIILFSFLTIIDFNIFKEWGVKFNQRAVQVLIDSPDLALASSASSPVLLSVFLFFVLTTLGVFLFHKIVRFPAVVYPFFLYRRILFTLVVAFFSVFLLRGGFSTSPLTFSSVFYSSNQTLNYAALNTGWNLIRDVLESQKISSNPFRYMSEEAAMSNRNRFYPVSDSSVQLLTAKTPNVVLIILESFTADLIAHLGGEKKTAPYIDSLMNEGLLFKNFYATGNRTDIGFISILTGTHSLATRSYLSYPDKTKSLPSLSEEFAAHQYQTSFYYGGESEFFNFRSFILNKKYNRLVDIRDFNDNEQNSKWGAQDNFVFQKLLVDLKTEAQPFFTTLMTLTNHEPFELPEAPHFPGDGLPNKFRSTAYYTDQSIRNFIEIAKTEPWFLNTLFVFVADHGHRLPKEKNDVFEPARYHIPFLMYGPVLDSSYRGKVMSKYGSQTDIAATLLAQLGWPHSRFATSNDLMNPTAKGFAFSTFDDGFLMMDETQQLSFDNKSRKILYQSGNKLNPSVLLKNGQSFMQASYADFMRR